MSSAPSLRPVGRSCNSSPERGDKSLPGREVDRIQARYVDRALTRLDDAEAYAVLAAAGDEDALIAIKDIIAELEVLNEDLQGQRPDQEDRDETDR